MIKLPRGSDPFIKAPPPSVEEGIAKRIPVVVRSHQPGRLEWEYLHGYVVTYLDVRDYCQLHKLDLIEVLPGSRPAYSYERTDLF